MQSLRRLRILLIALLAITALIAASCGDDDAAASGDDGMADMSDSAMADDMSDPTAMGDMTDMDMTHEHDETALAEWPADAALPTVAIDATAQEGGDVHLSLTVENFEILPSGSAATSPTSGHLHVSVDGAEAQMYFGTEIDITGVPAGDHHIVVSLSSVDHETFAVDGAALQFQADVTVPGEVAEPDVVVTIDVDADGHVAEVQDIEVKRGQLVRIDATSEVMEELHVHAYDRTLELHPGHTASVSFVADIPGAIEIELEGSGTLVAELKVR